MYIQVKQSSEIDQLVNVEYSWIIFIVNPSQYVIY